MIFLKIGKIQGLKKVIVCHPIDAQDKGTQGEMSRVWGQASAAETRMCPGKGEPEGQEGTGIPVRLGVQRG